MTCKGERLPLPLGVPGRCGQGHRPRDISMPNRRDRSKLRNQETPSQGQDTAPDHAQGHGISASGILLRSRWIYPQGIIGQGIRAYYPYEGNTSLPLDLSSSRNFNNNVPLSVLSNSLSVTHVRRNRAGIYTRIWGFTISSREARVESYGWVCLLDREKSKVKH